MLTPYCFFTDINNKEKGQVFSSRLGQETFLNGFFYPIWILYIEGIVQIGVKFIYDI
jgi:hypothetical protein